MTTHVERLRKMQESLDSIEQQVKFLTEQADARAGAIYEVLNALSDFATDREVDGADLVDKMSELFQSLRENSRLGMDMTPMVVVDRDGSFLTNDMDTDGDIDEAGIFFGGRTLDPGEKLLPLDEAQRLAQSMPAQRG